MTGHQFEAMPLEGSLEAAGTAVYQVKLTAVFDRHAFHLMLLESISLSQFSCKPAHNNDHDVRVGAKKYVVLALNSIHRLRIRSGG